MGVCGLGAVGAHIVRRLLAADHQCVVFDVSPLRVAEMAAEKAYGARSVADLAFELDPPRIVCLTGEATDASDAFKTLKTALTPGDIIIDTTDDDYAVRVDRARDLALAGIDYVQVAMTGPTAERTTRCLLISADESVLRRIEPLLRQIRGDRLAEVAPAASQSGPR